MSARSSSIANLIVISGSEQWQPLTPKSIVTPDEIPYKKLVTIVNGVANSECTPARMIQRLKDAVQPCMGGPLMDCGRCSNRVIFFALSNYARRKLKIYIPCMRKLRHKKTSAPPSEYAYQ